MKSWKLALLALTTAALSATVGCSSSSTPTTTDKDAGETKDTGTTDKDGGGGGQTGFACNVTGSHYCFLYSNLPSADEAAEEAALKSSCTAEKGTAATSCASADVVGCCTTTTAGSYTTEECFYSGTGSPYTATTYTKADCPTGTFSTKP